MHAGRTMVAAIAALATVALAPAAAQAATVTVTGDDGNPVALTPGAPFPLRNMDITLGSNRGADAQGFRVSATAPDGVPLITNPNFCWSITGVTDLMDYRGNGAYGITVTEYTDRNCATVLRQSSYQYVLGAGVAIAPPAGVLLTRAKNSFTTNTHELGFTGNPGASIYEVNYARGGVIGPDGGISGPSSPAFVNSTTGKLELRLSEPGTYTVVARATRGGFNTPWSPAVTVRAKAPFDLRSTSFPDSRGPNYSVRGQLGTDGVRGRVRVAIARGTRGGKFRSLGRVRIRANGTFTKRFTVRRLGRYRLRYSYRGGSLVVKGSVTEQIRIRRRIL